MIPIYKLQSVLARKNYVWFNNGKYNLNIIGIRSEESKSNLFDDWLCVVYKDDLGVWTTRQYPITTDPGKYYLQNPLNKNGTIILVPGQYRGAYKIGIHGRSYAGGGYKALEQVRPMRYVRDNNKDEILDFDLYRKGLGKIEESNAKTNIHRASKWSAIRLIERYSAGCQVFKSPNDFEEFIDLCDKSRLLYGNSFTYTLIEERDLR